MPRKPDPDLEDRILKAAQLLWKRGGEKALTLRAVAKAAGTNTPAVYRRFKDRKEIVVALLQYYQADLGKQFRDTDSIEDTAEVYVDYLVQRPHAYELLLAHGRDLIPRPKPGRKLAPIRDARPNFASLEERLAQRLGGLPEHHTKLALAIWSLAQGAAAILLSRAIPEGHEEELRSACRAGVKTLIDEAARSRGKK